MLIEYYASRIEASELEEKLEKYITMISDSLQYYELISVFDIRNENNLDNVILTSLLKGIVLRFCISYLFLN